jgi:hypoxanthine-DNA glycosylase
MSVTEKHPLEPFLPKNAKILMLGSFPPQKKRWSMDFFYPNWQNDFWRLMGVIYHNDKHFFEIKGEKRFCKERVIEFCNEKGIAIYDTASEVIRLKDNASDKFLEVVTPTDIQALLEDIPHCTAIVTTGQKATDVITSTFNCQEPSVGNMESITIDNRNLHFWRMPSTSRAYPLPLDKKAEAYKKMFASEELLKL